jgi:hypothetical protein
MLIRISKAGAYQRTAFGPCFAGCWVPEEAEFHTASSLLWQKGAGLSKKGKGFELT